MSETFHEATPIFFEVFDEIKRQDQKWGLQNHDVHFWNSIITEELGESAEAALDLWGGPASIGNYAAAKHYQEELVHVAACAIQAIVTLRRLHPAWNPRKKIGEDQKAIPAARENKGEKELSEEQKATPARGESKGEKSYEHALNCEWRIDGPCTCDRAYFLLATQQKVAGS